MTAGHKKLYEKLKERKKFKIDYNGKEINVKFNSGLLVFDNIKINMELYNDIQTEKDYLDLIMDIKNCLSYTLKIKECNIIKSKNKSIA